MTSIKSQKVRDVSNLSEKQKEVLKNEKKWIEASLDHVTSLIDVGCGDGRLTTFLSNFTDRYVGVDLDEKAVANARVLENEKIEG